jgi:hypothetical protein
MLRRSIAVAAILVLVAAAIVAVRANARQATPLPGTPADDVIRGLLAFDVPSAAHTIDPVDYPQDPPAGGPHHPIWQACRFYDQPVVNEHAVHSLEHGAVWITYQPDLPADQRDRLRQLAESATHILVSPYPGLPSPVVASAWGYQLRLDGADDPRLEEFIRRFLSQGPERGATCSSGTDDTIPWATPPAGSPVATVPAT